MEYYAPLVLTITTDSRGHRRFQIFDQSPGKPLVGDSRCQRVFLATSGAQLDLVVKLAARLPAALQPNCGEVSGGEYQRLARSGLASSRTSNRIH